MQEKDVAAYNRLCGLVLGFGEGWRDCAACWVTLAWTLLLVVVLCFGAPGIIPETSWESELSNKSVIHVHIVLMVVCVDWSVQAGRVYIGDIFFTRFVAD